MTVPQAILGALSVYLALGVLFAIPFVLVGAGRLDPDARQGTWGFRVLIFPGATLLWPLLAKRWAMGARVPTERTPHKEALRRSERAER
ncbi:hypothetical protein Poly30_25170 [Planctomycetes bacterium Poly30]|uniref:Uncharacterized protein n=1 Tax=Saltatorellus ferox TaxID=2528018 RepID=A0A518ESC6_9BACT|nr:hypothetical protein Poly30_25170 [Planctomycetes bacterium Poly30]